ncbi:MAG: bifunctional adenosylcobinamide kinase/adenosylcobinamide-phosphate guanylyltransferase [Chloroflexota bacterium]|nr:MAG: bifunctional adenosylcobinamide kinase/adenosylcobinamide-phosphate guanylyltransferase [Chloroflexota bacterium]
MTARVTLVTGGARSGKSGWAELVAGRSNRAVTFVATAIAGDAEMAARIAAHRAARPSEWMTIEEPFDLPGALAKAPRDGLVVLDCLTLWTATFVAGRVGDRAIESVPAAEWRAIEDRAVAMASAAIDVSRRRDHWLIAITNEVGSGIVPVYPLGRRYRDVLGRVNAAVAAVSDDVVLMVAGLPVDLRKIAFDPRDTAV